MVSASWIAGLDILPVGYGYVVRETRCFAELSTANEFNLLKMEDAVELDGQTRCISPGVNGTNL